MMLPTTQRQQIESAFSTVTYDTGLMGMSGVSGLEGLFGLGDARLHNNIVAGIQTGLATAAALDPEPFSKTALAIAAAMTSILRTAFSGCGDTCVQATYIVDKMEPYLVQNRDNYLASKRYASQQATALALVDGVFAEIRQGCSDPALGAAGQRCISERLVEGGTAPWCHGGQAGCDWVTMYRNPIAKDPNVIPDPVVADAAGTGTGGNVLGNFLSGALNGGGTGPNYGPLLMLGGGVVLVLMALGGDGNSGYGYRRRN